MSALPQQAMHSGTQPHDTPPEDARPLLVGRRVFGPEARWMIAGALLLLATVLAGVAVSGLTGVGRLDERQASAIVAPAPGALPARTLALYFEDRDDGAIAVLDETRTRELARIEPGTNGFMRSTLRGMARERRRHNLGAEQPFHLGREADGRLVLDDHATGRHVELQAFGPSNAAAFAALLTTR